MVKTELEVKKAVTAMAYLFMFATERAFKQDEVSGKDFWKGIRVKVTLKPGQNTDAEQLIDCEVEGIDNQKEPVERGIPITGHVSDQLKSFVTNFRKVFTSIHEYKKVLTATVDKIPDAQDLDWTLSVISTYTPEGEEQDTTPEYSIMIPIPGSEEDIAIMVFSGKEETREGLKMLGKAGGWFIPKLEGFEDLASDPNDTSLRRGLDFRMSNLRKECQQEVGN